MFVVMKRIIIKLLDVGFRYYVCKFRFDALCVNMTSHAVMPCLFLCEVTLTHCGIRKVTPHILN